MDPRLLEANFSVLFVCTGNVCRSVLAERLAEVRLRGRLGSCIAPFRVGSAGTEAQDGNGLHPQTAWALAELGASGAGFTSRRLTRAHIDGSGLILCAGREHLDQVVTVCPSSSRRAYLLREFARLASSAAPAIVVPQARRALLEPAARRGPAYAPVAGRDPLDTRAALGSQARQTVAAVARLRGQILYVDPRDDEIPDPRATPQAFLRCALSIDTALRDVLDALCPDPGAVAPGPSLANPGSPDSRPFPRQEITRERAGGLHSSQRDRRAWGRGRKW